MSEHTKGPWRVGRPTEFGVFNPCRVEASCGTGICEVYGISLHSTLDKLTDRDAKGLANARLIAAAPDLLEACKLALRYFPKESSLPKKTATRVGMDRAKIVAAINLATKGGE